MSPRLARLAPVVAGWLVLCAPLALGLDVDAAASSSGGESSGAVPAGASLAPEFQRFLDGHALPAAFDLDLGGGAGPGAETPSPETVRKPKIVWIAALTAVTLAGSAFNAFDEKPRYPWHYTNEGWFGQETYAGGADKASHIVSYYAVARLMNEAYRGAGMSDSSAILLATGTSIAAGFATEIGDGTNKYGFSWQDIIADSFGAAAGFAVMKTKTEDLVGFRFGLVPAPDPTAGGLGKDYSEEIYTADFKIAGLGRRMHFNAGPAKFFLLSLTYGSKGYPYSDPVVRQRQVGLELGVNFREVLTALHVPPQKWWGVVLYTFFDLVRFPYTAWGFRYDLNHDKWYGPDTGDSFPNSGFTSLRGAGPRPSGRR